MQQLEDLAEAIKEEMMQPGLSQVRYAELHARLMQLQEEQQ